MSGEDEEGEGDVERERNILCLSLRPLLAARMAFLEWDVLLLGTARRKGGKRSARAGKRERRGRARRRRAAMGEERSECDSA
jgi:hypothetical protein